MNNNDTFNMLLHLTRLIYKEEKLKEIFALKGLNATRSRVHGWRLPLDNPRSSPMPDRIFDAFIDGLFEYRNLKREQGVDIFNFDD